MQLRGTCGISLLPRRCIGVSIDLAHRMFACRRTSLTDGWKLLEQGPKSQKAPAIWLGGVSAVISASDLDAHSFGVEPCKGNANEGALP